MHIPVQHSNKSLTASIIHTFIFANLTEFTLRPLAGFGEGGVPQGVVRVVLKGHARSRRPLGVLLAKTLERDSASLTVLQTHKPPDIVVP